MSNLVNKELYLKYKNKYLILKKQTMTVGGSDNMDEYNSQILSYEILMNYGIIKQMQNLIEESKKEEEKINNDSLNISKLIEEGANDLINEMSDYSNASLNILVWITNDNKNHIAC